MGELAAIIHDANVCRGMPACTPLMGKVEPDCITDGNPDKAKAINNGEAPSSLLDEGWARTHLVMGEKEPDCHAMDNKFIAHC